MVKKVEISRGVRALHERRKRALRATVLCSLNSLSSLAMRFQRHPHELAKLLEIKGCEPELVLDDVMYFGAEAVSVLAAELRKGSQR